MSMYHFQTAQKIIVGNHSLAQLPELVTLFGHVRKVFIVAQRAIDRQGIVGRIEKLLAGVNVEAVTYTGLVGEPTEDQLNALSEELKGANCQLVIGIGGGSVLDAAKVIAVLATNEQSITSMLGIENVAQAGLPTILIPTTTGTGAEVTPNAIVTFPERQLKIGIVSRYMLPSIALLDPMLTVNLPPAMTASTGMDAFTHALESYISKKANPISDMFALEAIRLISSSILASYNDGNNVEAREAMLLGSMYGGMALTAAGTAAVHALAYPIGGQFHVPHGVANAMLLPDVMKFNKSSIVDRLVQVAAAMGLDNSESLGDEQLASLVIERIEYWTETMKIGKDLSIYGITQEDVPALALAASQVTRLMDNNPAVMSVADIEQIYLALLPNI